jgi:hypothetical protein
MKRKEKMKVKNGKWANFPMLDASKQIGRTAVFHPSEWAVCTAALGWRLPLTFGVSFSLE